MIWTLLLVYQLKHFLADYPLQGKYMLKKFEKYPTFILPLLAHAGVHGLMTFTIVLLARPQDFYHPHLALGLALADMAIHFIVDRIKASPDLLGRFKAITKKDYIAHLGEVRALEDRIAMLSASQSTIEQAADLTSDLNDLHLDWHETMKSNTFFWWALGWDQAMHHLTHYWIIYMVVSS